MSAALAVFDVDRTLVLGSSGGCFIEYLWQRGKLPVRNRIYLSREMWRYRRRVVPEHRIVELGSRLFFGLVATEVEEEGRRCMEEVLRKRVFREALDEIRRCRRMGLRVVLASGSPSFIVEPLGEFLGADVAIGSRPVLEDGRVTREVQQPIPFRQGKVDLVEAAHAETGVDWAASRGYSDRQIDLPLLERVGEPHAVNPDRMLKSVALGRGWTLERWTRTLGDSAERV